MTVRCTRFLFFQSSDPIHSDALLNATTVLQCIPNAARHASTATAPDFRCLFHAIKCWICQALKFHVNKLCTLVCRCGFEVRQTHRVSVCFEFMRDRKNRNTTHSLAPWPRLTQHLCSQLTPVHALYSAPGFPFVPANTRCVHPVVRFETREPSMGKQGLQL